MYTVYVEHQCGCFKKSEFSAEKTFENQQDAYNYSNILAELMNEDFCTKHVFNTHKLEGDDFLISVADNPHSGSCGTGASDSSCSSGSCGC